MLSQDQPLDGAGARALDGDPARSTWVAIVACALASVAFTALLLPTTQAAPVPIIEDDGFFYAKIAYNIAFGHGSSFDGLNVTSGYHLLWGGCLAVLSKVVGLFTASRIYHLAAYLAFSSFLGLWAATSFFKNPILRVMVFVVGIWSFALTEALLLSAILLYVVHRFIARADDELPSPRDLVAIALVPLARIDAGLIVGLLTLTYLPRQRRAFWRASLAIAAGVLVHLASMLVIFGHVFSVSSMLKTGTSRMLTLGQRLHINVFDSRSQVVKVLAIAAFAALVIAALRRRGAVAEAWRRRWLLACAAVMAYFLALFGLGVMRSWYFTSTILVMAYLAAIAPGGVMHARLLTGVAAVVTLVVGGIYIRSGSFNELDRAHSMAFIQEVNRRVPPAEPIFQIDGSGFTGYWLLPPVIDGDGLVNSYDYMKRLLANDLGHYLVDHDICLVARNTPPDGAHVVSYHGLEVGTGDVTLIAGPPSEGGNSLWRFRLFLLRDPRCQRLATLAAPATPLPAMIRGDLPL